MAQTLSQTKQLRARVFQAHLQACGVHQRGFAKPPSAEHHLDLGIRTADLSGGKLEFELGIAI